MARADATSCVGKVEDEKAGHMKYQPFVSAFSLFLSPFSIAKQFINV